VKSVSLIPKLRNEGTHLTGETFYRCAAAAVWLALFSLIPVNARVLQNWSYQDLLRAADIVVVAEPVANENNADRWEWIPEFAQGVTTTFKVLGYLKDGGAGGDTIRVKHFIYTKGCPANGGRMINFVVGPLDIDANFTIKGKSEPWRFTRLQPRWLAFLKKTSDGFFIPVSGQIDPNFSFQELHEASMFDPTHGMQPSR
jgi:hypothetical protein